MSAWNAIADPWTSGLVTRAGLELVVIGALCGVLGTFVVLRGLAYAGEAFAHAVFPGAVAAAVLGVPIGLGGLATAIPASLVVSAVSRRRLSPDNAVGVVLVGSLACGMVLLSQERALGSNVESFLFGTPLAVDNSDILTTAAAVVLCAVVLSVMWRALVFATADPDSARAAGVRVGLVDAAFLAVLAAAVVAALHAVGTLLVLALIVTPAATARLAARRIATMAALSACLGAFAGLGGLYLSYYAAVAAGASVVVVATGVFALALAGRAALRAARRAAAGRTAAPAA